MTGSVNQTLQTGSAQSVREDLERRGYKELPEYKGIAPGARVRHAGQRYWQAMDHGTATVVAVLEKDPSSWALTYGQRDVEIVVERDKPLLPGMATACSWASYHTAVVTP